MHLSFHMRHAHQGRPCEHRERRQPPTTQGERLNQLSTFWQLDFCLPVSRTVRKQLLFGHSIVSNSVTPWTVACQVPLSMGFPRQEYWSVLPFPIPGDLPDPGVEPASPVSPALASGFFTTPPPGMPIHMFKAKYLFLFTSLLTSFIKSLTLLSFSGKEIIQI